jgi:hypothetical protein
MKETGLPPHIQVVKKGDQMLGLCKLCGRSLGYQPTMDAMKSAGEAHECTPEDKRDQTMKIIVP